VIDFGYKELPILDIDTSMSAPIFRNTLAIDKNMTREEALFDVYASCVRVSRRRSDTAQTMFNSLVLRQRALRPPAVGRVKMNMRLDLTVDDTVRILRRTTSSR